MSARRRSRSSWSSAAPSATRSSIPSLPSRSPELPPEEAEADGEFDPDEVAAARPGVIEVVVQAQDRLHVAPSAPPAGRRAQARLIDMLERRGIISGYEGSKPRRVLVDEAQLDPRRRLTASRPSASRLPSLSQTKTEGKEEPVVRNKWSWPLIAALSVVVALGAASCGGGNDNSSASETTTSSSDHSDVTAALVSDIGKFNDRSFNQSQLEGLNRAKSELGVKTLPLQSNQVSDYIPNLTTAIRKPSDIVISAGFLLADATNKLAKKFPDTHFAITDYSVNVPPFKKNPNVEGLTYAANESGCLVGNLAANMVKKQGGKQVIGGSAG